MTTNDPDALGPILANLAYRRIMSGMAGAETAALFAGEVSEEARKLKATGMSGKDIARWIEKVASAYSARIGELIDG